MQHEQLVQMAPGCAIRLVFDQDDKGRVTCDATLPSVEPKVEEVAHAE